MYERLWNPSLWEPIWRFSILIHPKWSSTGSGCNLDTWWPAGGGLWDHHVNSSWIMFSSPIAGNVRLEWLEPWKIIVHQLYIYICIDIILYYNIHIYIYTYHNRLLMVYPCNWWWTCYWETIFPGCRCGTGWKLSQSSLSWPMWPLPQQGWGPGDQYLSR